ncbi:MAG: DUF2855 family protein [Pseudomonadota bacterium]
MDATTELWVNRSNYRDTKIVTSDAVPLADGEIRVHIDKFGLTSNNVSYAVGGDFIGYWKFYLAEEGWGKVPVWGMADVVESNCVDVPVGERIWGFFPMASHAALTPGKVVAASFMDHTPHRRELPSLYNQYLRTSGEAEAMRSREDERCLLFPLFGTSFCLFDYLLDNEFFGAEQVLIGSVSSKTGFGLAQLLKEDGPASVSVVGLTSPGNVDFVNALGCCDQVVTYGNEGQVDAGKKAAYVDMSGNASLTRTLHTHLGENMVESCMVGATHWEAGGASGDLPGATPQFFFAPSQISKRNKEWGPGVFTQKASEASLKLAQLVSDQITVERIQGAEAASEIWKAMLENQVSPKRGIMVSI